jgi:hypothetical protein
MIVVAAKIDRYLDQTNAMRIKGIAPPSFTVIGWVKAKTIAAASKEYETAVQ